MQISKMLILLGKGPEILAYIHQSTLLMSSVNPTVITTLI